MTAPASMVEHPCCPRCGYAQRGVIATWADACPLNGVCAECGLQLRWAEIFQPDRFEPRWCIEFERRYRDFPRAALRTFVRSFRPWAFWSQLRMAQPIRPGRLIRYVVLLFAPILLAYVAVQGSTALYVRFDSQRTLDAERARLLDALAARKLEIQGTRQPFLRQRIQGDIDAIERAAAVRRTITISYPVAVFEAICFPSARQSSGAIVAGRKIVAPYCAPTELHTYTFGNGADDAARMAMTVCSGQVFGLALAICLPASLVLLPVSRRRAKVRWRHIARVAVYSAFIPLTVFVACATLCMLCAVLDTSNETVSLAMALACAAPPLMLIIWWSSAIHRYLRMPNGVPVAVLLSVMCYLLMLAAMSVVIPFVANRVTSWDRMMMSLVQ